jgi:hypothetical protein
LWRVFWDRVSWTICLGLLWTAVLLSSASWVARITGMSHQCPAKCIFLVEFTPKYFILFHAIICGIVFIISFFNLLLMYINTIDSCIWILYL